jgi:cytochrome b6-f complex iron-sulfur subunit
MNQSVSDISLTPITRRRFIQFLLGFSIVSTIAGILVPIIAYLLPKGSAAGLGGPVEVGKVEDFPMNASKVVSVSDKPVIVVNTKAGGLKAFSAICTHLGCIVSWNASRSSIHCPCHDGFFNPVTGAVVSGPPPKPLVAYEVVVKDNKVMIGKQLG